MLIHAINRGVDKRVIFKDKQDYLRFIHNLFILNNQSRTHNIGYHFNNKQIIDTPCQYINKKPRQLLVQLHAFCLMPNHYHLLLSPLIDNGISIFMQKLNMAYSKYFNQKYERVGTLYQGPFKSIAISNESHFVHLPYYIHLNPLDLNFPEWRQRKIKNISKAIKFLENYRWSSHLDYLGKKNFPSVTQRELLLETFINNTNYQKDIYNWLKDLNLNYLESKNFTLE